MHGILCQQLALLVANKFHIMKYRLLLMFISLSVFAFAQKAKIDTINISIIKSNYPLIAKTDDLHFIPDVRHWHICFNVKGQLYPSHSSDTFYVFYANQIYADKYKLSYLKTESDVRLEYIWLKKNKKFWMDYRGLVLRNNTSLDDVNHFFRYDGSEAEYGIGPLIIGNRCENIPQYILSFRTGEPNNTRITLIFDKKKRLKIIYMDYYHPTNLIIEHL